MTSEIDLPNPGNVTVYFEQRTSLCDRCPLAEHALHTAAKATGEGGSVHMFCHQTWVPETSTDNIIAKGTVTAKGYTKFGRPLGYSEQAGVCQALPLDE